MPPLALGLLALLLTLPASAQPAWRSMSPEERQAYVAELQREAEADRQRMMELLGVETPSGLPSWEDDPNRPAHIVPREGTVNWYDEAGNVHVRGEWGRWSNYVEAEAGGPEPLDPLVLRSGRRVETPEQWWTLRRPQILEDYVVELYGRTPAGTPGVFFRAVGPDSTAGGATVRQVVGRIEDARLLPTAPRIEMTLYLPEGAEAVPVVVQVGGFWGQSDELPEPVRQALDRGWAFATVETGPIQMDSGAGLDEGVIGYMNGGRPRDPDDWGVLAAWAWGLSRALDYLDQAPETDAARAAITGHSRNGKAALLTAALDTRWAAAWPSCAGAMGTSLEKRDWGETIDNVASAGGYHWMAGTFLTYAGRWDAMPGDAHFLMALVAPRPLFVTGGTTDQWSDPHGEFLAAVAADPVYELLGDPGLPTTEMPAPDVALTSGALAFRNHEGGHTPAPDWPVFYDWLGRYVE
ncbi:HMG-box domain-containing protein [Rubrivirga marina]|uniref:4-O-methyl-glucuronoyl methylesterase-like domain-containing protein n=1 Tax=Rubrivirga marina TaxID=1196024 RepID=A0A271IVB1_9BACT|nr:HMG-box domain-containing protein [Rubrivirga marina]PAP75050.1 hypothetical protein BSZ37_00585 [Rubrivirga marina]